MSKTYEITSMELGPMENFVYLITDIKTKQAAVIDPAWDVDSISAKAKSLGITITDVLLTHSHHDHINGLEGILNDWDAQVHLLKQEADFWQANLSKPSLHHGGDDISIGSTDIKLLHTPGHTPGSVCYRLEQDIITGDTLFVFGCGRCDLNGGDPEQMFTTLKKMKAELPGNMIMHPGHNYAIKTTSKISEQIEGNPFMHFHKCEDFTEYRMHTHDKTRSSPYHPILAKDLLK